MNTVLIQDIKKFVNYLLLPLEDYYYHQYGHSLDVMERALYLAEKERVPEEKKEILAIAALFHDTGFVIQYDDNEYIGAKIARNYLKTNLYPEETIRKIEKLILATAESYEPQDMLEKIIKDADLDNLGRDDFFETGNRVKRELETIKNIKIKDPDWQHASLQLLK
jgi:HD superfamily phosphodiesterase